VTNRPPVPIGVRIDGRKVGSVTRFTPAGAYVVVLATALVDPQAPVSITSTYVGQRKTATHATHLTLRPGSDPQIDTRMHALGTLPVDEDERHGCLYDHLQQLLTALQSLGYDTRIDVLDRAAELLDS
jgi:ABC-type transporter Mla subunit MlaD